MNTSIYCFRLGLLAPALRKLEPANAQGEYYLTDVAPVLYETGHRADTVVAGDLSEAEGVNDRCSWPRLEAELRRRTNNRWLRQGVTMVDPGRTYIDSTVQLANDVTLASA